MLNNRQQSGRRRGRGGQRQQGSGGRGLEQGNRIDNRARGNAPQMLEKYKTLARDAQLAGDRVMTEYYLQFADHYFRVVAETRARFEEQRRQRGDWQEDEEEGEGFERGASDDRDDAEDGEAPREEYRRREPQQRDDRQRDYQGRDSQPRDNRGGEGQYREGSARENQGRERQPREFRNRDDQDRAPRRNGRDDRSDDRGPRRNGAARDDAEAQAATIDIAVLPPAFGGDGPMIAPVTDLPMGVEGDRDEAVVAAEAPKRRGRPRKVPVADAG